MANDAQIRVGLIFIFRRTSMLYGAICGLAFVFPLVSVGFIASAFLRLILAFFILFGGMAVCSNLAEKKMRRLNDLLYTELEPERFIEEFIGDLYSKNPEKWKGIVIFMLGEAYHAIGSYKEEEALCLRHMNASANTLKDEIALRNDFSILGRMVIMYSDAGNAAAAERAFGSFRETASKITFLPEEKLLEEMKDMAYNLYLKCIGKTEECLGFLEWHCDNRPHELGTVMSHFRLAEAYEAGGYADEAEREYRFVAERGKNLYVADKAREKLASGSTDALPMKSNIDGESKGC